MTQEDKQLLLKDLCARLPYGVICQWSYYNGKKDDEKLKHLSEINLFFITESQGVTVVPYLRPMSSMTTEEYKEYDSHRNHICDEYNRYCFDSAESIDWLNEHHFDYRGLIPMGLALEATEGMYKTE